MASFGVTRVVAGCSDHQRRADLEERRIQRQAQAAIDQHPQGRTRQGQGCGLRIEAQLVSAHRHPRLVGQDAFGTGQHHAGAGTQTLYC
ncbi:hypothetical protein D3C72_1950020 [compost metagenome]